MSLMSGLCAGQFFQTKLGKHIFVDLAMLKQEKGLPQNIASLKLFTIKAFAKL